MKNAKAIIPVFAVFLFFTSPLPASGEEACDAVVAPGSFAIDLGKYSQWNSEANTAWCNTLQFDCSINQSHTEVGDATSSATSLSQLNELVSGMDGFAFGCLDKTAVLNDKGQKAFVGVYDSDLGYRGALWEYFEDEANECFNHYMDILNNANMCL